MMFDAKKKPVGEIDQPAQLGTEEKKSNSEIILQSSPNAKNNGHLTPNPHNAEAEESVIGALLLAPDEILRVESLAADDFYLPHYRNIFQVVKDLYVRGSQIDNVVISDELRRRDQDVGMAVLGDLEDATPSTAHIVEHAKIVQDLAVRRRLIYTSTEIAQLAHKPEGMTPGEMVAEAAGLIGAIDAGRGEGGDTFRFYTWNELDQIPEPEMLIDGLLCEGDTAMIYGAPTGGKTFLAINLAMACLAGSEWCGFTVGKPLTVLYATNEGTKKIPHRFGEAGNRAALTPEQRKRLFTVLDLPQLFDPSSTKNVKTFIADFRQRFGDAQLDLLIIDTMRNATTGANLDTGQDTSTVNEAVNVLKNEFDCTVLLVHHGNKADKGGPIGSIHIQGHMDLVVKAEKKKKDQDFNKLIFEKVKDEEVTAPLAFCIESGLKSGWVRWLGSAAEWETRSTDTVKQITQALNRHPGEWMTISEIMAYVPVSKQKIHRTLNQMLKFKEFSLEQRLRDPSKKPSKSNPLQYKLFVHVDE